MDITKYKFYDDDIDAVYVYVEYDDDIKIELDLKAGCKAVMLNVDDVCAMAIQFGLLPESTGKG